MARLTKAKRGKHRWIGLALDSNLRSRKQFEAILDKLLINSIWKLYDFKTVNDVTYSIVKIDLNSYKESIEILNSHELIVTITSSGKIKLVRERMEIKF
jgi:hypothetical protein